MAILPGMCGLVGFAGGIPEIAFLQATIDLVNASTFTFSGESFGDAAADRHIVVGVAGRDTNGTLGITSVTIGGVAADQRVFETNSQGGNAIYTAFVPDGATGDVVIVSSSGDWSECSIGVWRLVGLASIIPVDIDNVPTDDTQMSLEVPADGVVIAASRSGLGQCTWTGLTEDWEINGSSNLRSGGASDQFDTAGTVNVTAAWISSPSSVTAVCAAFR